MVFVFIGRAFRSFQGFMVIFFCFVLGWFCFCLFFVCMCVGRFCLVFLFWEGFFVFGFFLLFFYCKGRIESQ